jgi:hypothetical protein
LSVGLVGQELKFTVDASRAGHGEVKVTNEMFKKWNLDIKKLIKKLY